VLNFPVLKADSGGKSFKIFGLAVDKRQGFIIIGSFFVYWLLYRQVSKLLPLSTLQAAILFAPFMIASLVLAFVKADGRHLDWWIRRKWVNGLRPKVLFWRRENNRAKKPLRDSVQEALPFERILWEMIRTRDGEYALVFEIQPINLSVVGEADRIRTWTSYAQFLNTLDFPVTEITRSREGSVSEYAETLKENVLSRADPSHTKRISFAKQHLLFLHDLVEEYNVYERTSYAVLTYRPQSPDLSRGRGRARAKDLVRLQKEAEEAYRVLSQRADVLYDGLGRMGARPRVLVGVELLDFLKDQTAGERNGAMPKAWTPVTLAHGSYEELGPEDLRRVLEAAEEYREAAPPAIGIGDLTISDKIAPDSAHIHADYVRIGETYHATLFVIEYMPEINFGDLHSILNIPGRVKIVKHMRPLHQEKAVGTMGGRVAELIAAEYTASDGNVIATEQRRVSRESAELAMHKLLTGELRMFEVSFLIHCEADSREELHSLVETVRTRMAALRADVKLAREESWQGFLSALPLGRNHLSRRYSETGLMTDVLAAMFVYGTYQINHPEGVLYGIDWDSSAPVVLDSRELMNPHMVVLGTSGGGKTQTIKALSTRLHMRGHRVVVIDPEGNSGYGETARGVDGEYLVFGVGTPSKFNPCDLNDNYMNLNLLASASDAEEDEELARRKARSAALDGKVLMLTRLVSLMISGDGGEEGLTSGQQGLVDKLWYEVYAEKGITEDPATHRREPPTFKDFFRLLADVPELAEVRQKLYPWEAGALRTVFDSQTNVDLDNPYLVLQVAGVKGRAKAAIMYALLDFLSGKLSDPDEPADCFIDEFWSLLKYPMAAEFAEELWRSGRARDCSMVAITQEMEEFLHSVPGQVIMRISATQLILRQKKRTTAILEDFVDLSEEQKQQIPNFQAGEGFLIVEEKQIPLYVVCSEQEHRLFNTDQRKRRRYEEQDRRELAERRKEGLPEPDGTPALEAPRRELENGERVVRRLTPHGRARALLSDEEIYVPEEGDYEDVLVSRDGQGRPASPVRNGGSAGNGHHPEGVRTGSGGTRPKIPHLTVPEASPGRVPLFAVTGPTGSRIAYHLAGLIARAAKRDEREVLFVDADGYTTRRILASLDQEPPDALITGVLADEDFEHYVARDPSSGLKLIVAPLSGDLPARGLLKAVKERYDCVIVACGKTRYAEDWLLAADHVIVASGSSRELATACRETEDLRGRNGAILAAMGRLKLTPDLMSHEIFRMPSAKTPAFARAEKDQAFATLTDPEIGAAFRPLAERLVTLARAQQEHAHDLEEV
jgi:cellulose biosynthesis protein BcsQ